VKLSVVIPTRDRLARLEATLAALGRQTHPAEIVVVDNGSTDGTIAALEGRRAVRLVEHPHNGASGARNAGLRVASGDVVLFLGDDTAPASDDLLARHVALHSEHPEDTYAVLGRVAWAPGLTVTPLMRWLEHGPQFAYAVKERGPAGPEHFYTAHVSAKTAILRRAGGFDEALPIYFEDNELGVRLFDLGLRLDYRPELLVHHDHAVTLASWLRRQTVAGRSGFAVNARQPRTPPIAPVPDGPLFSFAAAATRALRNVPGEWQRLPTPLRSRVYSTLHYGAYTRAYRSARTD
jgi:GT2 family glycosyltransferase